MNRENLAEYVEGQEPQGLPIQVVEQRQRTQFDRALFARWLCYATDVMEACGSQAAAGCDACLQLNVLLRLHLDSLLAKTSEDAPVKVEGSDDDAAESGKDDAWLLRAWRHVRRGVTELLAQEAAAKDADAAYEEEKQEQHEVATACADASCAARPSRHITDARLAKWMRTVVDWQGECDLL